MPFLVHAACQGWHDPAIGRQDLAESFHPQVVVELHGFT
jgi:hypothetical protein